MRAKQPILHPQAESTEESDDDTAPPKPKAAASKATPKAQVSTYSIPPSDVPSPPFQNLSNGWISNLLTMFGPYFLLSLPFRTLVTSCCYVCIRRVSSWIFLATKDKCTKHFFEEYLRNCVLFCLFWFLWELPHLFEKSRNHVPWPQTRNPHLTTSRSVGGKHGGVGRGAPEGEGRPQGQTQSEGSNLFYHRIQNK